MNFSRCYMIFKVILSIFNIFNILKCSLLFAIKLKISLRWKRICGFWPFMNVHEKVCLLTRRQLTSSWPQQWALHPLQHYTNEKAAAACSIYNWGLFLLFVRHCDNNTNANLTLLGSIQTLFKVQPSPQLHFWRHSDKAYDYWSSTNSSTSTN